MINLVRAVVVLIVTLGAAYGQQGHLDDDHAWCNKAQINEAESELSMPRAVTDNNDGTACIIKSEEDLATQLGLARGGERVCEIAADIYISKTYRIQRGVKFTLWGKQSQFKLYAKSQRESWKLFEVQNGGEVHLRNLVIEKFWGGGKGGVLMVANGGIVTAKDCVFQKNQCGWNAGGAVALLQSGSNSNADGGKMVVEGCSFIENGDNYGFKYSGVIENEGTFIARNSLFKKNQASFGGGAVWTKANKVFEAYGCEFDSNKGAWGNAIGGVALVDEGATFTAQHCLFVRNTAGTTGGVVHVKAKGTFIGTDCEYEDNTANKVRDGDEDGDHIWAEDGAITKVTCSNGNEWTPCTGVKCDSNYQCVVENDSPNCISTTMTRTTTTGTSTTTSVTTTTETTTTTLMKCGRAEYRNVETNRCAPCPRGTFQSSRQHTNSECIRHSTCGLHEYVATPATSSDNVVCKASEACAANEWESKPHAPGEAERECTPITPCAQGDYVRVAATETADQQCRACGDNSPESFAGGCTTTTRTSTSRTTTTKTSTTRTTTTTTTRTGTTTTTTTTTTATTTTTTATSTTATDTTTTVPIAVLKEDGVTAYDLHYLHGASAADLAAAGFTVEEVAAVEGMEVTDIAAAAGVFEDKTDATAADFKAVPRMSADLLKQEGFGALELMEGGFTATQLSDAGYSDVLVAAASTSYGESLKNPNATTNMVIVVAVILISVVVVVAAVVVHKKRVTGDGSAEPVAFENPMYADGSAQPTGARTFMDTSNAGYMDVPAAGSGGGDFGQSSSGYMDVAAPAGGQQRQHQASAGYMDVSPQQETGSDSDEEV